MDKMQILREIEEWLDGCMDTSSITLVGMEHKGFGGVSHSRKVVIKGNYEIHQVHNSQDMDESSI